MRAKKSRTYCERYMVDWEQESGFRDAVNPFLLRRKARPGLSVQLAPGGSDAAVQTAYTLKPLPCSLPGSFMHRSEKIVS